MKELFDRLTTEFADKEYAHSYMESHLVSRLAAQLFVLRKQRNWSQEDLARESGIAQESISKIESGNFDSITLKTLRKFSRAFDVHAHVSFVPFSKGILDTSNLTVNRLEAMPRTEDLDSCRKNTFRINFHGQWQMAVPVESTAPQIESLPLNPTAPIQSPVFRVTTLAGHD